MNIFFGIILITFQCCQAFADEKGDTLVWPSPPDRPRIRHVMTISSGANLNEEHGVLSSILRFFAGDEKSPAWLIQPVGIAVSGKGIVYVADPGARGVHRIDVQKKEHKLAIETSYGNFRSPVGIVCGKNGKVYIADSDAGIVVVANEDLEEKGFIKEHLERPTGLCILHENLYVVDAKKHCVVVFDLDGKLLSEFGHRGDRDGEFNFPVQIAGKDSLFVVDALNYRIQMFDERGKFQRKFGKQGNAVGRFASPKAVALDSDGDIYVSDALLDNLQIFDSGGRLLLSVGGRGSHDGEFMMPSGIAIDAQDRIYVVETMNRRIQVFQYLK